MSTYLGHMKPFFGDVSEFAAIGAAVDGAVSEAIDKIEQARRGLYGGSAEGEYLDRQEAMYGIAKVGDEEKEEERRRRIAIAYSSWAPYTEKTLIERVESTCGAGSCEIFVDAGASVVSVAVACGEEALFSVIGEMVRRVVPCHLQVRMVKR